TTYTPMKAQIPATSSPASTPSLLSANPAKMESAGDSGTGSFDAAGAGPVDPADGSCTDGTGGPDCSGLVLGDSPDSAGSWTAGISGSPVEGAMGECAVFVSGCP